MDTNKIRHYMMASADAVINLAKDIRSQVYEDPLVSTQRMAQFSSKEAFMPFTENIYTQNGAVDYNKAIQEKEQILQSNKFNPVPVVCFIVSGPAGSGKSTMANSMGGLTEALFTAGRNLSASDIHDAVSSYYTPKVGTISALKCMTRPHDGCCPFMTETSAMNPRSLADAQLSAILADFENYKAQLKNVSDAIDKMERRVSARWLISDAAVSKAKTHRKRKHKGEDSLPPMSTMTSNKSQGHPQFTNLKDVLKGNPEKVEMAHALFSTHKSKSLMPHLARGSVCVVDEGGMVSWHQMHTKLLIAYYIKCRLGLGNKLGLVLLGSEAQSAAIRTIKDGSFTRKTSDVSILQHVKCGVMRKELKLEERGHILMIHENKRCDIPEIKTLLSRLYFGVKDENEIAKLDRFIVPDYIIDNPTQDGLISSQTQPKSSLLVGDRMAEKVNLSQSIRIYSSNAECQAFIERCKNKLPSYDLPIHVYINWGDFKELFECCIRNPKACERHGYTAMTFEEFITKWLNEHEIMGISGVKLTNCKRVNQTVYQIEGEYYPPIDLKPRRDNHIATPLFDADWEDWDSNGEEDSGDVEMRFVKKTGWHRNLLKLNIPKIPQQYMYYKGSLGILYGRPGMCVREHTEMIITGYIGTIDNFVKTRMDEMCANFITNAGFVLKLIQQAYMYVEEYNKMQQTVKGTAVHTEPDQVDQEIAMADLDMAEENWYQKDRWRDVRSDNYKLSAAVLTTARDALHTFYDKVAYQFPDLRNQNVNLYCRDLVQDPNGLVDIDRSDYIRGHYLPGSEPVITYGVQNVPLAGYLASTLWYFKNTMTNLAQMVNSSCKDEPIVELYGVVVFQQRKGYIGVVMPTSNELMISANEDTPALCLLSCTRVPIVNTPAMTVAQIQGQTFDKVAIGTSGRGFLTSQQQGYVAITRPRKGIAISTNIFRRCNFIQQTSLLTDMVSKGTIHVA